MIVFNVNTKGDGFELTRTTHEPEGMKVDVVLTAPFLRAETDDNGPTVAALVQVAGALLVAEYENEHSLLNDAARAKNQAEAFAAGFRKMTEGRGMPIDGLPSASGPQEYLSQTRLPCAKCGHLTVLGQPCINCELEAEAEKEKKPDGQ